MPPVIIAAAVTYGATAAGVTAVIGGTIGAAGVITGGISVASIIGGAAAFAYSSSVASSQASAARAAAADAQYAQAQANQRAQYNASLRDTTMVLDNPIMPRKVILGETRTSGPLWPWFSFKSGDGTVDVHTFAIVLAAHECESIEKIYFNEDEISLDGSGSVTGPAKYLRANGTGLFSVQKFLGAPGQQASSFLIQAAAQSGNASAWTSACTGDGLCYLVVNMIADFDALGDIGVPNVSALVRGVKALDPRTGLTVWTQNPALLARWFMLDCPYSPATLAGEVNNAELIASANVCDELINFSATRNEKRYTCNGALSCADLPLTNLNHILDSMDGDAVYISGQWQVLAGYYKTPTLALTEDDLSESSIMIAPYIPKADLYNTVTGTHFSASNNYTAPISYADVSSPVYVTEDGGEVLPMSVDFALVNDAIRCQMIAWQRLARARNGATISLGTNMRGYDTSPGRNVTIRARELLGDAPKTYMVMRRTLDVPRLTYLLQETGPEVWAWDYSQAQAAVDIPNTSFPDALQIPAPGSPAITESLYQTTGSTGVRARATVTWVADTNVLVNAYLVEYKLISDTLWIEAPRVAARTIDIDDLAAGIYSFRVRCETGSGRRGLYSPETTKEILGLTARPADIANLSVLAIAGRAAAAWDLSPDLDVRIGGRIVIRHTPLTTGAVWENGIVLQDFNGDAVNAQLDLLTGTYMAKAVDSTGNYSATMASAVLTESQVTGFTTVATLTEAPSFAGTKTTTYVDGSTLRIAGAALWDSLGAIDGVGFIDNLGGVAPSGSYQAASAMNFGSVQTRRISAVIQGLALDVGDLLDDRGDVDDWGLVDGGEINDVDVTAYYSLTQTDPTGSPVWGPWVPFMTADVTAWGVRFLTVMQSASPTHNYALSGLTFVAKSSP